MSVPSVIMTASIGVRYPVKLGLACFFLGTVWFKESEINPSRADKQNKTNAPMELTSFWTHR
jgi:hypothetical protein